MARLRRYFVEDQPQHLIQRGNNREPIFAAEQDYRFYLDCLADAADEHGLAVHAFVLMTNHVHLLATPRSSSSIGKTFQSLGRRYVQYFNHAYQRTGTLWEGRYKATVIESDRYMLTCMRYIELNPVRAAMVNEPARYPWSSYLANAFAQSASWLTRHPIYLALGKDEETRCAAYRGLFRVTINGETLKAIREATNKGWALGNDRFRERIEALSARRAAPKPAGRPRKRDEASDDRDSD